MSARSFRITGPGRAVVRAAALQSAEGHVSTLHWCTSCGAGRMAPAWIRDLPAGGCFAEMHCPDCDIRVFGEFTCEQASELHAIHDEHTRRLQRFADQMQDATAPDWARSMLRRLRDHDIVADDVIG